MFHIELVYLEAADWGRHDEEDAHGSPQEVVSDGGVGGLHVVGLAARTRPAAPAAAPAATNLPPDGADEPPPFLRQLSGPLARGRGGAGGGGGGGGVEARGDVGTDAAGRRFPAKERPRYLGCSMPARSSGHLSALPAPLKRFTTKYLHLRITYSCWQPLFVSQQK